MKEFPVATVPIQDRKMVRDMHSKAVVATDTDGLQAYRDRRAAMERMMNTTEEVQGLKEEINTIKNDVTKIKEILMEMAKK